MLSDEEKEAIEKVLEEKLGVDSAIVKTLSDNILLNVKEILVNYREEYLKADSAVYEKRADKLAQQLQLILYNSIKNFDIKTEDLKIAMGEIAEQKVHSIVNSKLDKILNKFEDQTRHIEMLSTEIVDTRKKTIHFAYISVMEKKPIRTILLTVLGVGFILGTLLKVYGIQLDLIEIGKSIFEFFIHRFTG